MIRRHQGWGAGTGGFFARAEGGAGNGADAFGAGSLRLEKLAIRRRPGVEAGITRVAGPAACRAASIGAELLISAAPRRKRLTRISAVSSSNATQRTIGTSPGDYGGIVGDTRSEIVPSKVRFDRESLVDSDPPNELHSGPIPSFTPQFETLVERMEPIRDRCFKSKFLVAGKRLCGTPDAADQDVTAFVLECRWPTYSRVQAKLLISSNYQSTLGIRPCKCSISRFTSFHSSLAPQIP
jgi:hypothetical protein